MTRVLPGLGASSDPAEAVHGDAGHGASPVMFLRALFPGFMVTPGACSFLADRARWLAGGDEVTKGPGEGLAVALSGGVGAEKGVLAWKGWRGVLRW